ncbi:MAG: hypothetical protein RJA37_1630 [Verrucomicrobiota bacterium]|jgi:hypothetical protein
MRTLLLLAAAPLCAHVPPPDARWKAAAPGPAPVATKLAMTSAWLAATPGSGPAFAQPFQAFPKNVKVRWDSDFLYVEATGLPDHPMMTGIKSWQQQVPMPQSYVGESAWRIPLKPVPAKEPMSAKNHFLRGAIALAANGIPIFNALNNRGDDALAVGELDDFGGHCGRADDYHYHVAPLHLEKQVGKGKPLAMALDGYPIYGLNEPDGSAPTGLDAFNGHESKALGYHYHASKKYPYINGGFHGEVKEIEGQVDPQPSARKVRQADEYFQEKAIPGALIKSFTVDAAGRNHALTYTLNGRPAAVKYAPNADGSWTFNYENPDGTKATVTYSGRNRGPGGKGAGKKGGKKGGEGGKEDLELPAADDDFGEQSTPPPGEGKGGKSGKKGGGKGKSGPGAGLVKPTMADTVKLNVYADNWFVLYINGKLVATDPIDFLPHNVVSVDVLPEYPMTIAVMAKDNANAVTGMEYGDNIGDGGFILKFSDGTVTDAAWKARSFSRGPLNGDKASPKVEHDPIPANWFAKDFDDRSWAAASVFTEEDVGPKEPFYQADFKGAKWIWSKDLGLDNTVIFRAHVDKPGFKARWTTKPEIDISGAPLK